MFVANIWTPITTDNGKHSDSTLAAACANDMLRVSAGTTGNVIEGRRVELKILDLLEKHFRDIANTENEGIAAKSHDHLFQSTEADPARVATMEAEIVAVLKSEPVSASWIDKTAHPEGSAAILANIHVAVHKWVRLSQHMHRNWFAYQGKAGHHTELTAAPGFDPNHEHVLRWKALHEAPSPEAHRRALHEMHTGERLPPAA